MARLAEGAAEESIGDELNLDSPKQMQQLLYCKLGLPIRLYSKMQKGSMREKLDYRRSGPATDEKAINMALANDALEGSWKRDALRHLSEAKSCHTRRKNYWLSYPMWVHPRDDMVHGSIINCGTVTHRPTGSDPNLLQIPSRDGGRVRSMVVPKRDQHVIMSPDFNGEELRITASLSKDPVMLDAYVGPSPKDIHNLTTAAIASAVLNREAPEIIEMKQLTLVNGLMVMEYDDTVASLKSQDEREAKLFSNVRKLAKGVNFLLVYMGQASTLSRNLSIPVELAEQFLDAAYATYAGLAPWQDASVEFAREHGYVETSYGNRRHLGQGLFSDDNGVRSRQERQAVNAQVQGCGADILKIVLAGIHKRRIFKETKASLIVPPYDEIAASVPLPAAWEWWCRMKDLMSITPPGHAVPQLPELKASALNWGTCIELGADPTEDEFMEAMNKQLRGEEAA